MGILTKPPTARTLKTQREIDDFARKVSDWCNAMPQQVILQTRFVPGGDDPRIATPFRQVIGLVALKAVRLDTGAPDGPTTVQWTSDGSTVTLEQVGGLVGSAEYTITLIAYGVF